jgi:hypothetical protein
MAGVEGLCDSIFDKHVAAQQQSDESADSAEDVPANNETLADLRAKLEAEKQKVAALEKAAATEQASEGKDADLRVKELESELAEEKEMHASTGKLWWVEKELIQKITTQLEEEHRKLSDSWEEKHSNAMKQWEDKYNEAIEKGEGDADKVEFKVEFWKKRQEEVAESWGAKLEEEQKIQQRKR